MPGRITSNEDTIADETGPPVIPVSSQPVVCLEHPCIIKNLDRGISSVGGDHAIDKVC